MSDTALARRGPDILTATTDVVAPSLELTRDDIDRRALHGAGSKAADLDQAEKTSRNYLAAIDSLTDEFQNHVFALQDGFRLRQREGRAARDKIRSDLRQFRDEAARETREPPETTQATRAYTEISRSEDSSVAEARLAWGDLNDAQREYNRFLRSHPVKPPARHSETPATQTALIIAAILVEIAVNGFFFMNATAGGLIGSLFEVIAFAPINVGAAVLAGLFSIRYARHVDWRWRTAGITSGLLLAVFLLAFNLYLAAVRLSFDPDVGGEVVDILLTILSRQALSVLNYEALGILILGLALAGFACFEAYRIFDPYPGFTRVYRRLEDAREVFHDLEEDHVSALHEIEAAAVGELEERMGRFYQWGADHRKLLEVNQEDRTSEGRHLATLQDIYGISVAEFRTAYLDNPVFKEDDLAPAPAIEASPLIEGLEQEEAYESEIAEIVAALEQHSQSVRRQLHDHIAAKRQSIDALLKAAQRGDALEEEETD